MSSDREEIHIQATQNRLRLRYSALEEIDVGLPFDWTPTLTTLLLGARDMHSPLSLLRGQEEVVVREVAKHLIYKYQEGAVTITPPAHSVGRVQHFGQRWDDVDEEVDDNDDDETELITDWGSRPSPAVNVFIPESRRMEAIGRRVKDRPQIAFSPCLFVDFPKPTDININMMPFVMGDRNSLPTELWPYYDQIIMRCPVHETEQGSVMYLTVQEGYVEAQDTQRRAGLHIEAPSASVQQSGEFVAGLEHSWGIGMAFTPDELKGGLYIASNTSNTTAIWDALVDNQLGAVDTHGGIEHLRPYIGKGKKLPTNLLVWLTDRTPHEALPQQQDGYRQFFRLVTSEISVWFAVHSTPNPKVPVPAHVKIIGESKFASNPNPPS